MAESVEEYLVKDGMLKALDQFSRESLEEAEGLVLCWKTKEGRPFVLHYYLNEYELTWLLNHALDMVMHPDLYESEDKDI